MKIDKSWVGRSTYGSENTGRDSLVRDDGATNVLIVLSIGDGHKPEGEQSLDGLHPEDKRPKITLERVSMKLELETN